MDSPIPQYTPPDFNAPELIRAPTARVEPSPRDGVAPENFHATSNYPEYVHVGGGRWLLAPESRMDSVLVLCGEALEAVEPRRLKKGDPVVIGRTENGEEGIFVHVSGFRLETQNAAEKFSFHTYGTRETPFSYSYDQLYRILRHDRRHGTIVWVLGPAVAFDKDSRSAMQELIEDGYCHALLAGNALATHDLEAGCFGTGLGQDIYTQTRRRHGHYNHLDILNEVRRAGNIKSAFDILKIRDGIIFACEKLGIPYVLAGSIRDDGPLPEVITDSGRAQDAMRVYARKATTVMALATQLHSIAFGNMTPSYRIMEDGTVRPVFFYVVDMTEFSAAKLVNRGSAQSRAILTNVQDFIVNLRNNLKSEG